MDAFRRYSGGLAWSHHIRRHLRPCLVSICPAIVPAAPASPGIPGSTGRELSGGITPDPDQGQKKSTRTFEQPSRKKSIRTHRRTHGKEHSHTHTWEGISRLARAFSVASRGEHPYTRTQKGAAAAFAWLPSVCISMPFVQLPLPDHVISGDVNLVLAHHQTVSSSAIRNILPCGVS